ncbi:MAG: hypothetical protein HY042_06590 [Spirochaetia bacterium]|nr:hypothetical protein [Spirochaetia bacterium]
METYKSFRDEHNEESARELADEMYRNLSRWLDVGRPPENFMDDFDPVFLLLHERGAGNADLIDLGLMHTADAVNCFRNEGWTGHVQFHVSEARMPFLAFLDETTYRRMKNVEFSEVDFQIFEIIQGDFPHDAAQNLLIEHDWIDIWLALRYLDRIEDRRERLQLIERTMGVRETMHEKLIFLAYLFVTDPEVIDAYTNEADRIEFNFPADLERPLVAAIKAVIDPFLKDGILDTAWEQRLHPEYEDEVLFTILGIFEVSQCPINAGWVRVLERAMLHLKEYGDSEKVQPMPEFVASILNFLPDADLQQILETSLVLPTFHENLVRYTDDCFHDLAFGLSRAEEVFVRELEHHLASAYTQEGSETLLRKRLEELADIAGFAIVTDNNEPRLVKRTEA